MHSNKVLSLPVLDKTCLTGHDVHGPGRQSAFLPSYRADLQSLKFKTMQGPERAFLVPALRITSLANLDSRQAADSYI